MKAGEDARLLVSRCEAFVSKPYVCAAGWLTVGYGHVVKPGEAFEDVTEAEGMALLESDLDIAASAVSRYIQVPLGRRQFDALTSFVFNLGGGALQRSTLRKVVNRQEFDAVPAELAKWVHGGGRKLKGLARRRHAESLLWIGVPAELAYHAAWA